MSTLDRFIAQVQAAKDKAQSTLASVDGLGASSEAVTDVGHAVGAERYIDGGQHMTDLSESGRAELHAIVDQSDELLALAESLKTAGPGAARSTSGGSADSGTQPSSPQYEVTTGADPKPNPVHATPAHTREPSRKIGDPVEPPPEYEIEPTDRLSSKFGRAGKSFVRGSGDLKAQVQDSGDVLGYQIQDTYDPLQGSQSQTSVDTRPPPVASGPTAQEVNVGDALGTAVVVTAVIFEGIGRFKDRARKNLR